MSRQRRALLVTGEESAAQVKLRAARLGGCERVEILADTDLDAICATLEQERPAVCVIDSVQTLYSSDVGSAPGSVSQVREAAARLLRVGKEAGVALFLVGHVTKDGAVAGPRVLEHLVDCVLQFEGDRYHAHRILRAAKNRFGSTNELGVFEMTGTGLVGVPDASALFGRQRGGRGRRRRHLHDRGDAAAAARDPGARRADRPGDAAARRHRRRPEAARDDPRGALAPRRLPLGCADVFVNVAGGVRIDEPGADLGDRAGDRLGGARTSPLRDGTAAFGEIGAHGPPSPGDAGRAAPRGVPRSSALADAIVPAATKAKRGVNAKPVETLRQAIGSALAARARSENPACSRDFP